MKVLIQAFIFISLLCLFYIGTISQQKRAAAIPLKKEFVSMNKLFNSIKSLQELTNFSPANVSNILEINLVVITEESNKYFFIYRSDDDVDDAIKGVELRVPTAESTSKDGIVELTINIRFPIQLKDIRNEFGKETKIIPADPRAPDAVPNSYVYTTKRGELRFGCTRGAQPILVSVVLDRTETK